MSKSSNPWTMQNKVKDIDVEASDNDDELITKANKMFQYNKENGITRVYSII